MDLLNLVKAARLNPKSAAPFEAPNQESPDVSIKPARCPTTWPSQAANIPLIARRGDHHNMLNAVLKKWVALTECVGDEKFNLYACGFFLLWTLVASRNRHDGE
jgi:hypothetical protein